MVPALHPSPTPAEKDVLAPKDYRLPIARMSAAMSDRRRSSRMSLRSSGLRVLF